MYSEKIVVFSGTADLPCLGFIWFYYFEFDRIYLIDVVTSFLYTCTQVQERR